MLTVNGRTLPIPLNVSLLRGSFSLIRSLITLLPIPIFYSAGVLGILPSLTKRMISSLNSLENFAGSSRGLTHSAAMFYSSCLKGQQC